MTASANKNITIIGLLTALALIFSYIETIIPYPFGVPGIKLGLANLVIILALYLLSAKKALAINILRIALAGLLFTGLFGMLYSLAGAMLSFLVMWLCKKSKLFSMVGVSIAGGVMHNIGQLCIAALLVSDMKIFFYVPVLLLAGLISGLIIGLVATILYKRSTFISPEFMR